MTQTVNCPGCSKQIWLDDSPQVQENAVLHQQINQLQTQMNQPKTIQHKEIIDIIPKGVNFMSCPGGDCGHTKLENPDKTTKFFECPHCDTNTVPKYSKFCPTCGKNLEDEDLSESNVDISEDKGW